MYGPNSLSRFTTTYSEFFNFVYLKLLFIHFRFIRAASFSYLGPGPEAVVSKRALLEREAAYCLKTGYTSRAATQQRYARNANDKAKTQMRYAKEADDKAAMYLRWAADALKHY